MCAVELGNISFFLNNISFVQLGNISFFRLYIEQIYFWWAYFFNLRLCCKLEDEDDLEDLNY